MPEDVRQLLLETIEVSLQAQLTAVRRLRKAAGAPADAAASSRGRQRRSQVSIAYDILEAAAHPLHISQIIEAAQKRFHLKLDRESLVSALTKRLTRDERFARIAPNTFALRPSPTPGKEE
jgi:hypothetical protein